MTGVNSTMSAIFANATDMASTEFPEVTTSLLPVNDTSEINIPMSIGQRLFIATTTAVIAIIITVVNVPVLIVWTAGNRRRHTPSSAVVVNLMIFDLSVAGALYLRVGVLLSKEMAASGFACVFHFGCMVYGGVGMQMSLLLAVLDRYIAVVHPLRYHHIVTYSVVIISVCATHFSMIMLSFAPLLPVFNNWGYNTPCAFNIVLKTGYLYAILIMMITFMVVSLSLYGRVLYIARRHQRKIADVARVTEYSQHDTAQNNTACETSEQSIDHIIPQSIPPSSIRNTDYSKPGPAKDSVDESNSNLRAKNCFDINNVDIDSFGTKSPTSEFGDIRAQSKSRSTDIGNLHNYLGTNFTSPTTDTVALQTTSCSDNRQQAREAFSNDLLYVDTNKIYRPQQEPRVPPVSEPHWCWPAGKSTDSAPVPQHWQPDNCKAQSHTSLTSHSNEIMSTAMFSPTQERVYLDSPIKVLEQDININCNSQNNQAKGDQRASHLITNSQSSHQRKMPATHPEDEAPFSQQSKDNLTTTTKDVMSSGCENKGYESDNECVTMESVDGASQANVMEKNGVASPKHEANDPPISESVFASKPHFLNMNDKECGDTMAEPSSTETHSKVSSTSKEHKLDREKEVDLLQLRARLVCQHNQDRLRKYGIVKHPSIIKAVKLEDSTHQCNTFKKNTNTHFSKAAKRLWKIVRERKMKKRHSWHLSHDYTNMPPEMGDSKDGQENNSVGNQSPATGDESNSKVSTCKSRSVSFRSNSQNGDVTIPMLKDISTEEQIHEVSYGNNEKQTNMAEESTGQNGFTSHSNATLPCPVAPRSNITNIFQIPATTNSAVTKNSINGITSNSSFSGGNDEQKNVETSSLSNATTAQSNMSYYALEQNNMTSTTNILSITKRNHENNTLYTSVIISGNINGPPLINVPNERSTMTHRDKGRNIILPAETTAGVTTEHNNMTSVDEVLTIAQENSNTRIVEASIWTPNDITKNHFTSPCKEIHSTQGTSSTNTVGMSVWTSDVTSEPNNMGSPSDVTSFNPIEAGRSEKVTVPKAAAVTSGGRDDQTTQNTPHSLPRQMSTHTESARGKKRRLRQSGTATLVFCCCWFPFTVVQMLMLNNFKMSLVPNNIATFLITMNAILNPFIYVWGNARMRRLMLAWLRRWKRTNAEREGSVGNTIDSF